MVDSPEAHRMRLVTEGVADAADVDRFILRYLALYLDGGGDLRDPMALKAMQAGREQAERVRSRYAQARKDPATLAEEASPVPGPRPGETEHSRKVRLVAEDRNHVRDLDRATALAISAKLRPGEVFEGSEAEAEAERARGVVEADRERKALDDRLEAARQARPHQIEYTGVGEHPHARSMRLLAAKLAHERAIEAAGVAGVNHYTAAHPNATTAEVEEVKKLARLEYTQMVEASQALADDETAEALELLKARARKVYRRTGRIAHGLDK